MKTQFAICTQCMQVKVSDLRCAEKDPIVKDLNDLDEFSFLKLFFPLSNSASFKYKYKYKSFLQLEMKPFNKLCNGTINKLVVDDFPGPQINVRRGDTASIIVRNNEDYNVTIHWHGLSQRKNPWSDGPEYITQCPIQPKSEFTYEIKFEDEEGTLWWHAHSDWVRATVHGAIVVKPAEGTTYPFDEPADDFVIILGEWYNRDMNSTVIDTLEIGGDPDISDSYTINGFPGPQDNCPSESAYSIIVIHGKTYLLRIVNAAMNEEMFFGIQDHNITVVGQDGAYIKPIDTRYILITPGQTMDVLLTADRPFGSYYMVASLFLIQWLRTIQT
ncbi:laccase-14 [Quercus suber]|uniref:laccase n=1 Tax=Quercus suber TaxID=58331 RepID=A0AAW0LXY7_QUESU